MEMQAGYAPTFRSMPLARDTGPLETPPTCVHEAANRTLTVLRQTASALDDIFGLLEGPQPATKEMMTNAPACGLVGINNDLLHDAQGIYGRVTRIREMLGGPK